MSYHRFSYTTKTDTPHTGEVCVKVDEAKAGEKVAPEAIRAEIAARRAARDQQPGRECLDKFTMQPEGVTKHKPRKFCKPRGLTPG